MTTEGNLPNAEAIPSDMRAALDAFNQAAQEIINSKLGHLESVEPPPMIYHYTNDLGLRGILESGQLWLTDIFALNDPSELKHGFSHAVDILSSKSANGPPESQIFVRHFADFGLQGAIPLGAHYFLCSFSSRGDDLGQWRAYADNGRGYALGFDAQTLENAFTKENGLAVPNNGTFPVQYNDALLREVFQLVIEQVFDLISLPRRRNLPGDVINAYMGELQLLLTLHTLHPVVFFKNEAYINEQEYRFLQIHRADLPPPSVKLRTRPYSLVRYREFDWKGVASVALKKIIIGPAADRQKAAQFATDCLRFFHVGTVDLIHSEIPYRAQ
jgi:DUF2971 family protein